MIENSENDKNDADKLFADINSKMNEINKHIDDITSKLDDLTHNLAEKSDESDNENKKNDECVL